MTNEQINAKIDRQESTLKEQLSDKAASLSNTSLAIAIACSMTTGGYLSDNFGFRSQCDIMALMAVVIFVTNTTLIVVQNAWAGLGKRAMQNFPRLDDEERVALID